jgi:nucleoside-diphosphate-sugar epimerase
MRVTITGATGFIGAHVTRAMVAAGYEVVVLARATSDLRALGGVQVTKVIGDLSDAASMVDACRGADVVVHAAAVVRGHGTWDDFRPGVEATRRLLDAMERMGVPRLVHLSSIGVYGMAARVEPLHESQPLCDEPERWNHYIRQKVLSERLVLDAHARGRIEPVILRVAATLGPGDRASLPAIFAALRDGKMAVLGGGGNRVPFVVVDDLVDAVVRAVAAPASGGGGRVYNVSGTEKITQAEFLGACARALGVDAPRRHVPVGMAKLVAGGAEWIHRLRRGKGPPPMTRLGVTVATCDLVVDCSAARRDLGWSGDSIYDDAIRREVQWLEQTAR